MTKVITLAMAMILVGCGSGGGTSSQSEASVSSVTATIETPAPPRTPSVEEELAALTVADFQADAAYPQFQHDLSLGIQATERDAAGRGTATSGTTLKLHICFAYELALEDNYFFEFRLNEGLTAAANTAAGRAFDKTADQLKAFIPSCLD